METKKSFDYRKSYNDDPIFYDEKKKRKKRKILFILILIAIVIFILVKIFGTKTVESENGVKHQIGNFGLCDMYAGGFYCKKEATHRIKRPYMKINFCEEHWKSEGQGWYLQYIERAEDEKRADENSDYETQAKICAEKAVKDNLKSPSTANFCKYSEMNTMSLGNNRWKITGYVEAENSFGATVRENWVVTLTLTESGFTDYSVEFSK